MLEDDESVATLKDDEIADVGVGNIGRTFQTHRGPQLCGGNAGQPLFLLRLRTCQLNDSRRQKATLKDRVRHAIFTGLFEDETQIGFVPAESTELFGYQHTGHANLTEARP